MAITPAALLASLTLATFWAGLVVAGQLNINRTRYPDVPDYGPRPNPAYMVDNTHNQFHVAPDKGTQDGPVWDCSGSFEAYMTALSQGTVVRCSYDTSSNASIDASLVLPAVSSNTTVPGNASRAAGTNPHNWLASHSGSTRVANASQVGGKIITNMTVNYKTVTKFATDAAAGSSYWLTNLAPLGTQPLAPSGYEFYRDVVADYKADNKGNTDASEAINAAVQDGNRCGKSCSSTSTLDAIIYFPPGTYKICSPVIQFYYTQFIGDAINPSTIKGCSSFKGIALFDTDPYIPEGYMNQNQFFRHIRNFIFDLTDMPSATDDSGQALVPTGLHWQAAQATTLQNLVFNMPVAKSSNNVTHVGIFMENGSGGFVSDLTFNGGAIGWRAGSQQYTARSLTFRNCQQSVQMVWDWGFNWQDIDIDGGTIAFNISGRGGSTSQGTGSVSILDSSISNVPIGVLTNTDNASPNIVLDNVRLTNVQTAVETEKGGSVLTGGTTTIDLWAIGRRYNGSTGSYQTGALTAPRKASNLLVGNSADSANFAKRLLLLGGDAGWRYKNDGTGDQTAAINMFLQKATAAGQVAYFPAGVYQVGGTVFVPTGSRVQGASWSQIQGSGFFFSDRHHPQVMVRVGNKGEVGSVEIVEMLFSVKGATAGAVLMQWNVAAASPGSAAMWDSHFRVGGAAGSDLDAKTCPKNSFNEQCIAASLLFHVTPQANGFFENVWAWAADHDNDLNVDSEPDASVNQVSVYAARGMLIESQGPSWLYGTGSEHSVMYQYQLY
ncbi:hypothetical protein HMPREF1624_02966 [Sporothrix schenckii ATCC 58251]|uniref:Rhamnogalacturonase A/B/Epimerase-like pectate lyase domain-containing protein n=1 Tax=Sporothrix schenckii (strain ATCC 58251 / de Perez 2211183) TaxID=1391915 RepID=U7PXE3_SPOS1|nr:hypothetical protein HMPREF1624_02966 [Sporothrix schenckii ATCC 58251]